MSRPRAKQQPAEPSGPFQTLVVRNPFLYEMEEFKRLAGRCAEAGVTHLTFTEIERSYWEIDDPRDPYIHWSVVHTSMLKLFPPEVLKDWAPRDYVKRAREVIAARAAILKETGLKGATFLYDPMYWPESAFRRRPDLRGPRVDHPERCLHPRYAPCIDHPETLAFYRDAFRGLQELSGGALDLVIIRTNDSGTGFCWSNVYNGQNGPEECRHVSPFQRINRFLGECLSGMEEAGGKGRIYLGGGAIAGPDLDLFVKTLPDRCGYYAHGRANKGGERILTGFQSNFSLYPIRGVPNPVETLDKLAGCYERGWRDVVLYTCPAMYGNDWEGDAQTLKMIEAFNRRPCAGLPAMAALSRDTAAGLFGEENAEDVADAWWSLFHASELLQQSDVGTHGFYVFLTVIAQRWLTRPLVVFPERLTPEEKAHYQPWLFQANPAHEALDLLDLEPTRLVDGAGSLEYFNRLMDKGVEKYARARRKLRDALARGAERAPGIEQELRSMEVLMCFLKNMKNSVNFQIQVEQLRAMQAFRNSDPALAQRPRALTRATVDAAHRRVEINQTLRSEMDNALRLASLLEQDPSRFMETAPARDKETPFLLGADIAAALRRKVEIMQAHVLEVDELIGMREASA